MLYPTLITPPTVEALTLDEAKDHLRVERDLTEENAEIQAMIDAAVKHMDGFTGILGRALMPQTWSQEYECARGDLVLPFGPVSSVSSVTFDSGAFTEYRLLQDGRGPFLRVNKGYGWPSGAVVVEFVAGYSACPDDLKSALKLHVGSMYEFREMEAENVKPTLAYEALTDKYRRTVV
jgi:uncharacterized phiE125 gp8 family phage protein